MKVLFLKIGRTKKTVKKTKNSHEAKKFALQFHICCANFKKIDPETKKSKKKETVPLTRNKIFASNLYKS